MSHYIIIRGPLGIGKSTIAENLAKRLGATHFSVDRILDEFNLEEDKEDGYISQKSFLKANEIIISKAEEILRSGTPVIFDGNFYWKSQVDDLIQKLNFPRHVFTLKAPVEVCIERDKNRNKIHGEDAARAVYAKSMGFEYGVTIDTENKTVDETIEEIMTYL